MKTSLKGMMDIIAHEAIVLTPYKDVVGVWTVGIGHTAAAGAPDPATLKTPLTLESALELFAKDLAKFEKRVEKAFTQKLAQHEFDAAVSFDFNTGGILRATWVETFNAGNKKLAIEQIMNWQKPAAIIPRRKAEQVLFAKGQYAGNGSTMIYPASKSGAVLWGKGERVALASALSKIAPADSTQPIIELEPVQTEQLGYFDRIKAFFSPLFRW